MVCTFSGIRTKNMGVIFLKTPPYEASNISPDTRMEMVTPPLWFNGCLFEKTFLDLVREKAKVEVGTIKDVMELTESFEGLSWVSGYEDEPTKVWYTLVSREAWTKMVQLGDPAWDKRVRDALKLPSVPYPSIPRKKTKKFFVIACKYVLLGFPHFGWNIPEVVEELSRDHKLPNDKSTATALSEVFRVMEAMTIMHMCWTPGWISPYCNEALLKTRKKFFLQMADICEKCDPEDME